MNDEELSLLIDSLGKIRKIRSKGILAEVERIRNEGNNEKTLKILKKLEKDLEEIIIKEKEEKWREK